jgi:hypothetical protein
MKAVEGNREKPLLAASARVKDVLGARKPVIQIPSHVFMFSLMMAPVAAACK